MLTFRLSGAPRLASLALLASLGARPATAQGTLPPRPLPFQYMTLTTVESTDPHLAKMLLAPSFEASGEVYLEAYNSSTETGNSWTFRSNQERLTKQLDALAAAGWEVFEVHAAPYLPAPSTYSTRYLLRKSR